MQLNGRRAAELTLINYDDALASLLVPVRLAAQDIFLHGRIERGQVGLIVSGRIHAADSATRRFLANFGKLFDLLLELVIPTVDDELGFCLKQSLVSAFLFLDLAHV